MRLLRLPTVSRCSYASRSTGGVLPSACPRPIRLARRPARSGMAEPVDPGTVLGPVDTATSPRTAGSALPGPASRGESRRGAATDRARSPTGLSPEADRGAPPVRRPPHERGPRGRTAEFAEARRNARQSAQVTAFWQVGGARRVPVCEGSGRLTSPGPPRSDRTGLAGSRRSLPPGTAPGGLRRSARQGRGERAARNARPGRLPRAVALAVTGPRRPFHLNGARGVVGSARFGYQRSSSTGR